MTENKADYLIIHIQLYTVLINIITDHHGCEQLQQSHQESCKSNICYFAFPITDLHCTEKYKALLKSDFSITEIRSQQGLIKKEDENSMTVVFIDRHMPRIAPSAHFPYNALSLCIQKLQN